MTVCTTIRAIPKPAAVSRRFETARNVQMPRKKLRARLSAKTERRKIDHFALSLVPGSRAKSAGSTWAVRTERMTQMSSPRTKKALGASSIRLSGTNQPHHNGRENRLAKQRAGAEQLPEKSHDQQYQRVAKTVSQCIEHRRYRPIVHREGLGPASTRQLVTISPTNIDKRWLISKAKASMI